MLKEQDSKYIDKSIVKVFHFLELKGSHNFLIGSNKIRNILYTNDYDLNSNVEESHTVLRKEFLQIFEKAYANPDYYILDFKCGIKDGEPMRWTYEDLKKGCVGGVTFEQSLLAQDNTIKLDMCYVYNGTFTDINCLYNLYDVDHKDLAKAKKITKATVVAQLKGQIQELEGEKDYYKAMKRYFSIAMIEGKIDKDILKVMNSDYGMFYKFISFLKLVVEMLDQDFKPVSIDLIKSNLEYIKQFASHVTDLKIDTYLDRLVAIVKFKSKDKIKSGLESLIESCSKDLNAKIESFLP